MAGSALKYRHLNRDSGHRKALLRNLVSSLLEHESIATTWPKAKEAQRLAEKLITLGKRNTNAARNSAEKHFYEPRKYMPKLFGELRERYAQRPGGYTRVLRMEPQKNDMAPSAILELVDGPKDMRFAMTARAVAAERQTESGLRPYTTRNVEKVTKFRPQGQAELDSLVSMFAQTPINQERRQTPLQKEWSSRTDRRPRPNTLHK